MLRSYQSFPVKDIKALKQQMLNWANRFSICCFLDNHSYPSAHHSVEVIAGVGAIRIFEAGENYFDSLSSFVHAAEDYVFGHFNYGIKNKTEDGLTSKHIDYTGFPEYFLYVPKIVLLLQKDTLKIGVTDMNAISIYEQIVNCPILESEQVAIEVKPRMSRQQYLSAIKYLQKHIQLGDCYVINYCQEFYAKAKINPLSVYTQLSNFSPNPFAAFYKLHDKYLLCASPERFIKKYGDTIISQPIKGTAPRYPADNAADELSKDNLCQSHKDRSENVMVVDLVRNDLSKICSEGSVEVEELFGIYSFPNVHQMISTIAGKVRDDTGFGDVIKALFPMGSMTGAPKRRVMELTDIYEQSSRGIYSGTVGYITPYQDFDFNVVIRSIVYNAAAQYVSYHTGGAITADSLAQDEYEECLLKGKAMAAILSGKITI